MKKIIFYSAGIILFIGITVGLFALRFHLFPSGRVVVRDGKLVAVPDVGYEFESWSNGFEEAEAPFFKNLFAKPSFRRVRLDLPMLVIETEHGKEIESKETYLNCTVSLTADGELSFDGVTARVKGRGNSTFGLDKKPYKLKFDEKISVLGEDKAKEWTLIANHMDYSLIRNHIAYSLGETLELPYTTSANFVDVYVNDEYMGVYLLCEQVEVGKSRVDIEDSLEVDETGYLIEYDARAPEEGKEGIDYFYSRAGSLPYAIKSPDTEDELFTEKRVTFIKNYVNEAYDALLSGNYSEVCRYIDIDTFINGYILDELLKTTDIGFSSFYLYKDAGGKLSRGPVWDYDLAIGNSVHEGAASPESIYAGAVNPWYAELITYPEFRQAVAERLIEKEDEIKETFAKSIDLAKSYSRSFERNFDKWNDLLGNHCFDLTAREICEIKTQDGQLAYLEDWLGRSLAYMTKEYCEQ